jgi:hypothetical protein
MYSEDKLVFNMQECYGNEADWMVGLCIPPVPRKRFERFQGIKVFPGDKKSYFEKIEFEEMLFVVMGCFDIQNLKSARNL